MGQPVCGSPHWSRPVTSESAACLIHFRLIDPQFSHEMLFMRLLQRYLLLELIKVFTFLLSVLTVLLVFVGIFREATESGLGPFQILKILPFVVPSLLPFTIPATLLLTVCVVYGRVAGDNEVTAAKAAGVNVMSLLWPSLLMGAAMSICSLWLTDQVIPWAVGNIQRTVTMALEDIFLDRLRTYHQVTDQHRGYSITVMDVRGKTLVRPTFQYTPAGHRAVTVQAQEATIEFDVEKKQVVLQLVRGYIDIPGQRRVWFDRERRPFPMLRKDEKPKPRHMTIRDLRKELRSMTGEISRHQQKRDLETAMALLQGNFDQLQGHDYLAWEYQKGQQLAEVNKGRAEVHSRFAMASSCFFFVLLGSPFAIAQGRRQFLTSFFICFLPILLGYYPIVMLAMNLSKSGTVNPAWAMWVGNGLILIAALYVLRRVMQH